MTSKEILQKYHQLAAEYGDFHFKKQQIVQEIEQAVSNEIRSKMAQVRELEAKLESYVQQRLHLNQAYQDAQAAEAEAAAVKKANEDVNKPE